MQTHPDPQIFNGAVLPAGFAGAGDLLLRQLQEILATADDRPLYILNFLERLDESVDPRPMIEALNATGRPIFLAVPPYYPINTLEELPYVTFIRTH